MISKIDVSYQNTVKTKIRKRGPYGGVYVRRQYVFKVMELLVEADGSFSVSEFRVGSSVRGSAAIGRSVCATICVRATGWIGEYVS